MIALEPKALLEDRWTADKLTKAFLTASMNTKVEKIHGEGSDLQQQESTCFSLQPVIIDDQHRHEQEHHSHWITSNLILER